MHKHLFEITQNFYFVFPSPPPFFKLKFVWYKFIYQYVWQLQLIIIKRCSWVFNEK